jgi:hypothetical protein
VQWVWRPNVTLRNLKSSTSLYTIIKTCKYNRHLPLALPVLTQEPSDYCKPTSTCVNYGHQFLGLKVFEEQDLVIAKDNKGGAVDKTGRPTTPENMPILAPTPGAPKKIPVHDISSWIGDLTN